MDKKLKNLRSKMDGTVLRKGEVSEVDKERIYQAAIHSRKPKRKVTRFAPVLSIATCLILLLILGSNGFSNFIGTEQSLEMKGKMQPSQSVDKDESENKIVDDDVEFDKRIFENEHYQQIYDYLKTWELPKENRLPEEETESASSIKYKNGYSFSKDTGYLSSIDWGKRDPDVDERPLPTENQYMGVVMGYINEKAADMEVELLSPLVTQVYDKGKGLVRYVNVDGIKEVHNRSALLRERMELAIKYSNELPELKSEIEKIYTKAETLASASASLEDDSTERARELEHQYEDLKLSIDKLAGVIELAREDKIK